MYNVPVPVDLESITLTDLPIPYQALNGTGPDGRALWQQHETLGLDVSWFGQPGPPHQEPADLDRAIQGLLLQR